MKRLRWDLSSLQARAEALPCKPFTRVIKLLRNLLDRMFWERDASGLEAVADSELGDKAGMHPVGKEEGAPQLCHLRLDAYSLISAQRRAYMLIPLGLRIQGSERSTRRAAAQ